MGRTRVLITGMGIVCPVGNDLETSWKNLVQGVPGFGPITQFDSSDIKTHFAAEVKGFDAKGLFGARDARRMDRFTHFAMAAAAQAVEDAKLDVKAIDNTRIGVVLGSGIGGVTTMLEEAEKMIRNGAQWISPHLVPMMLPDTAPGKIAIEMGLRGPNMSIATACASGNNAIGEATAMIRRGTADVMISGGTEAGIARLAMAGFSSMGALSTRNDDPMRASRPFDKTRDGFVSGEGSGILILESEEIALKRGARIYGEVLGYGSSADAYHITAPAENGEGAVLSMSHALEDAGLEAREISYLNAHGTSTQLNDRAETLAIKQVFGEDAYNLVISSTKSMTGHLLGAAGAIEAVFSIMSIKTGDIPPTINYEFPDPECDLNYTPNVAHHMTVNTVMSNSFGFGGHNASLVFGRYANGDNNA
jgi:3-oxoacyl-[acyl-carrier-protein] synthase II